MSDIKERFGTSWISSGSSKATEDVSRSDRDVDADRLLGGKRSDFEPPGSRSGIEDRSSYDPSAGKGANPAFLTLGKQMIRFLRGTNDVDRLYSLADKMKLGPDDLEPVVEWLAKNYYIRVEPDNKFGNHEIRLTGRAVELA